MRRSLKVLHDASGFASGWVEDVECSLSSPSDPRVRHVPRRRRGDPHHAPNTSVESDVADEDGEVVDVEQCASPAICATRMTGVDAPARLSLPTDCAQRCCQRRSPPSELRPTPLSTASVEQPPAQQQKIVEAKLTL